MSQQQHQQLQQRQDHEALHQQQLEQGQHQRQDSLASLAVSLPPINTSMPKAAAAGDPSPDRHGVRHEDVLISLPGPSSSATLPDTPLCSSCTDEPHIQLTDQLNARNTTCVHDTALLCSHSARSVDDSTLGCLSEDLVPGEAVLLIEPLSVAQARRGWKPWT